MTGHRRSIVNLSRIKDPSSLLLSLRYLKQNHEFVDVTNAEAQGLNLAEALVRCGKPWRKVLAQPLHGLCEFLHPKLLTLILDAALANHSSDPPGYTPA